MPLKLTKIVFIISAAMADESNENASGSDRKMISINVKTPKEQHKVDVPEDGTVKDVSVLL